MTTQPDNLNYYRFVLKKWASENSNWYPSINQCDALLRELGLIKDGLEGGK